MDICNFNHEEIVHIGRNCPLCDAQDSIKDLENDIVSLEETFEELSEKYNALVIKAQKCSPELLL